MTPWLSTIASRLYPLGIPLPWRQLTAERKRFLSALSGIVVAVIMMLFQLGLYDALFRSVVRPIEIMKGEIMLVSNDYSFLSRSGRFPKRFLTQTLAEEDVEATASVSTGVVMWRHPDTGRQREIFLLGCDPGKYTFELPGVDPQAAVWTRADEVLFDLQSRGEFGHIPQRMAEQDYVTTEVSERKTRVVGLFDLGVTFAADGNLLAGRMAFQRLLPHYPSGHISIGLVQLRKGANIEKVKARLSSILPPYIRVLSHAELVQIERRYWAIRTPIGFVITASMLVGILVGAVIIYQILYADVSDHLAEYATLKAIGFHDHFFNRLILQQSALLSILGFIPGVLLASALFVLTRHMAHLPMEINLTRLLIVYLLTLVMCVAAGWLATGKLREANPADLFA